MKTIRQKLDEIKAEFLAEIGLGNFQISNVKGNPFNKDIVDFNILVSGVEQRCSVNLHYKSFYSHSTSSDLSLFNNSVECPDALLNSIPEQIELKMTTLMDEYSALAKLNGEP